MIEIKELKKTYSMGDSMVVALDDINLEVADREFVAIVGPSGSGKSTLMNILGCLDIPDEGYYALDGKDVSKCGENELSTIRNQKIGFVFQQFNLLQKLTALENVELPLVYRGMASAERRGRAEAALESVGLKERMRHKPNELSGGQQQRVAIARALVGDPALILADEPTGNLDSHSGNDIMDIMHSLHEGGKTIVLITHNNDIARSAQRRVFISDGRLRAEGAEAVTA